VQPLEHQGGTDRRLRVAAELHVVHAWMACTGPRPTSVRVGTFCGPKAGGRAGIDQS
jgi:hypothetical protein